MPYINGSLVRLRVFDGFNYSDAIYEISSTLSVSNNLEEVTTESGDGWREYRPFGLKSWQMTLSRFYDDEGRELNFNEVYGIITGGEKIVVEYFIGNLAYVGNARIASDSLPFAIGQPVQSSITIIGDGVLVNFFIDYQFNLIPAQPFFNLIGYFKNQYGGLNYISEIPLGFDITKLECTETGGNFIIILQINGGKKFRDIEQFNIKLPSEGFDFILTFDGSTSYRLITTNSDYFDYLANNINDELEHVIVQINN